MHLLILQTFFEKIVQNYFSPRNVLLQRLFGSIIPSEQSRLGEETRLQLLLVLLIGKSLNFSERSWCRHRRSFSGNQSYIRRCRTCHPACPSTCPSPFIVTETDKPICDIRSSGPNSVAACCALST